MTHSKQEIPKKTHESSFRFLIQKAEAKTEGGKMIITGIASTPNVDLDGEAMSHDAIIKMEQQINAGNIPLNDEHGKGWHDKLGHIVKGWVDERMQLNIVAELDQDNSKAVDLYKALKNGAKLGLSVAGKVVDAVTEVAEGIGKQVRTFTDILLTEISVTQSPANYDTWLVAKGGWLGTIAKSINEINKNNDINMEAEEKLEAPVETSTPEEKTNEEPKEDTKTEETTPSTPSKEDGDGEKKVEGETPEEEKEGDAKEGDEGEEEVTPETEEATEKSKGVKKDYAKKMAEHLTTMGEAIKAMHGMLMDDGGKDSSETMMKPEKETETKKSFRSEIPEAMILQKSQEIYEDMVKKHVKVIGGQRRIEEQVRAIAKRMEEIEKAPLSRKGVAVEKAFVGQTEEVAEKSTEKEPATALHPDTSAPFAESYKKSVGYDK